MFRKIFPRERYRYSSLGNTIEQWRATTSPSTLCSKSLFLSFFGLFRITAASFYAGRHSTRSTLSLFHSTSAIPRKLFSSTPISSEIPVTRISLLYRNHSNPHFPLQSNLRLRALPFHGRSLDRALPGPRRLLQASQPGPPQIRPFRFPSTPLLRRHPAWLLDDLRGRGQRNQNRRRRHPLYGFPTPYQTLHRFATAEFDVYARCHGRSQRRGAGWGERLWHRTCV